VILVVLSLEADLVDIDGALDEERVDILERDAVVVLQIVLTIDRDLEAALLAQDDDLKESIRCKGEVARRLLLATPLLIGQGVAHHGLGLEAGVEVHGDVRAGAGAYTALQVHMEPVRICPDFATDEDESPWHHAIDHGPSVWGWWVDDRSSSHDVPSRSSLESDRVKVDTSSDYNGVDATQVLDAVVVLDEVLAIHCNLELVSLAQDDELKVLIVSKREMGLSFLLSAPLLLLEGVTHHLLAPEAGIEVEGDVGTGLGACATLQVHMESVCSCWYMALDEDHLAWCHGAAIDGAGEWDLWVEHKWQICTGLREWIRHLVVELDESQQVNKSDENVEKRRISGPPH